MATKDAAVTWINISGALVSALSMVVFYLFAQDKVAFSAEHTLHIDRQK